MCIFGPATLVTAAVCGARTKGSYLRDKFHRLRARMGAKKAAVAVAHKILVAAFHMLTLLAKCDGPGQASVDEASP